MAGFRLYAYTTIQAQTYISTPKHLTNFRIFKETPLNCLVMDIRALRFSEQSVTIYHSVRCNILQD